MAHRSPFSLSQRMVHPGQSASHRAHRMPYLLDEEAGSSGAAARAASADLSASQPMKVLDARRGPTTAVHPSADPSAVEESLHAAVRRSAEHATGPDGRPLNILEPLDETFTLSTKPPRHVQSCGCLLVCQLASGIVTHCSENCTQVLGVEPAELIGHSIRELMADDQVDQVLDGAVRARRQMEMRATTMPTAEGNPAPSRSQVVPGKEGAADEEEKSAPDEVDAWISAFEEDRLPNAMISGPYYTMIVTIRDKTHCLCAHIPKQADSVVLEFLPHRPPTVSMKGLAAALTSFRQELAQANNVYRGAQLAVDRLNGVIGSDRCLFFRLMPPDYHAEAIAEERRIPELFPFLGLKFPPVDKTAREKHAAVPLRLIDDTTSFSSLIIGSFDHRQRPRTVVSPRGTATTIFSPTPTVEEPSQPRALKGETLAKETIERTIQCGVQPISSVHALPPPALHPAQMKHSHSDTDLPAQETSCPRPQPLDLSESVLRVPADGHSAVLRSLGVRSSQCFGVVVNGQLEAAAAFYGSAHPISWSLPVCQFALVGVRILSDWLTRNEVAMKQQLSDQLALVSTRLTQSLDRRFSGDATSVLANLMFGHPDLCEIAGSDTFALCCGDDWLRAGALPAQSWMEQFLEWVIDHAPDQRESSGGGGHWRALKVWSTINLSHDYPHAKPDARLAAGALVVVLRADPPTAFLCFRVATRSSDLWDSIDPVGGLHAGDALPSNRVGARTSSALSLAEMSAKTISSPQAQHFLRAFELSTQSSCAPWPVNAFPLMCVVSDCIVRFAGQIGWEKFFQLNLEHLVSTSGPEYTLPCRILREEIDGLLLLGRKAARSRPTLGHSTASQERGGESPRPHSDRVLCVNQGWCDIFGFVDESAEMKDNDIEQSLATAGIAMDDIMHPLFDATRTLTVWSRKKGHTTLNFRFVHVFSVLVDGEFYEVLAFTFSDVTMQQRVEQALLLAHQQSRRSEMAKQRMIGMVSHELRTPLTAILGFSEILQHDPRLTADQLENVSDIYSAGSHLLNIITNLLDLTKFELRDCQRTAVDMVQVTKEAVLWLQRTMANKLITLHLRLPSREGDLVEGAPTASDLEFVQSPLDSPVQPTPRLAAHVAPPLHTGLARSPEPEIARHMREAPLQKLYVLGDPVSLKRVLVNLLDNAAKFTPRLGTITVSLRSLPPLVPTQTGTIEVSVRDSGIGMPTAVLDRIWQPFYQADLSSQRELGGAGLGLAMVKSIVELHDGTVSVESEVGVGSKFTISFPQLDPADIPRIEAAHRERQQKEQGTGERPAGSSMDPTRSKRLELPNRSEFLRDREARSASTRPRSFSLDSSSKDSPANSPPSMFGAYESFGVPAPSPSALDALQSRMGAMRQSPRPLFQQSAFSSPRSATMTPRSGSPILGVRPSPSMAMRSFTFSTPTEDATNITDDDRKMKALAMDEAEGQPKETPNVRESAQGETTGPGAEASSARGAKPTSSSQAGAASGSAASSSHRTVLGHGVAREQHPDLRIMLVDDSEINRKLFCRMLASEGFPSVDTAEHGLEAVEKLITAREKTIIQWKKRQQAAQPLNELTQHAERSEELAQSIVHPADDLPLSEQEALEVRSRATAQAQEIARGLLLEAGVGESSFANQPELSQEERQRRLQQQQHAVHQLVSRQVGTVTEHEAEAEKEELQTALAPPAMSPAQVTDQSRPNVQAAEAAPQLAVPYHATTLLPKLIFLDLHMPHLDGFQTALAIRKLGFDTPLAALTASIGSSDKMLAEQLGFARYVTKPINRAQLRDVLQLAVQYDQKCRVGQPEETPAATPTLPKHVQRMPDMAEAIVQPTEEAIAQQQRQQSPPVPLVQDAAMPIGSPAAPTASTHSPNKSPPPPPPLPISMGVLSSPSPSPPPAHIG